VTVQVTVTLQVLGGMVCLWLLHRAFWTIQALVSKLRQLDEECRRRNEQWSAVHTAQYQREEYPRCTRPRPEWDWHIEPTIMTERPNDDLST
jgi:hypothetical protein